MKKANRSIGVNTTRHLSMRPRRGRTPVAGLKRTTATGNRAGKLGIYVPPKP
jgi:hypothetical protein